MDVARRLSQALSQHANLDDLVNEALHGALRAVGADAGSVLLADPETKQLVFRYVIGGKATTLKGMAIPKDQGIANEVYRTGKPKVTRDASRDPQHLSQVDVKTGYRTRDMITVPLKQWKGRPIGVLQVLNKRRGTLRQSDLAILTIISALAAAAIEQARLYEEARFAEVGRLLGQVGHDIKNLLTPVLCGVDFLDGHLEDYFLSAPQSGPLAEIRLLCREVLGAVRSSSRRMQDQVRQMAECVKGLDSRPHFAPCRFDGIVQQVYQTLSFMLRERGVAFRMEGLAELPAIHGDEQRLYLALYNLVNNAIPEVPAGGEIVVRGQAEAGGRWVEVAVADTGGGMSEDRCAELFSGRTPSHKTGGTGLGGLIVKGIVDVHGGEIAASSREGHGTTVRLRFPVSPPDTPRPARRTPAARAATTARES